MKNKVEVKINMGIRNPKKLGGDLICKIEEKKREAVLAVIEKEERLKKYEKFYDDTPGKPLSGESLAMKAHIDDGTILEYIKERYSLIQKYNYFGIMGGDIDEMLIKGNSLSIKREAFEKGYGYEASSRYGTHVDYNTGRDLKYLEGNYPEKHYKFYLSLNLEGDIRKKYAKKFAFELLDICKQKKLSISTKSFDHTYDSFNIYTWDKEKMAEVLTGLYQKYKMYGLFLDTDHFLQEPLEGVSYKHIGCVQEPIGSTASHSTRMGKLGALLDMGKGYVEACEEVGVVPENPWDLQQK